MASKRDKKKATKRRQETRAGIPVRAITFPKASPATSDDEGDTSGPSAILDVATTPSSEECIFPVDVLQQVATHLIAQKAFKTLGSLAQAGSIASSNLQVEVNETMAWRFVGEEDGGRRWRRFMDSGRAAYLR